MQCDGYEGYEILARKLLIPKPTGVVAKLEDRQAVYDAPWS